MEWGLMGFPIRCHDAYNSEEGLFSGDQRKFFKKLTLEILKFNLRTITISGLPFRHSTLNSKN